MPETPLQAKPPKKKEPEPSPYTRPGMPHERIAKVVALLKMRLEPTDSVTDPSVSGEQGVEGGSEAADAGPVLAAFVIERRGIGCPVCLRSDEIPVGGEEVFAYRVWECVEQYFVNEGVPAQLNTTRPLTLYCPQRRRNGVVVPRGE